MNIDVDEFLSKELREAVPELVERNHVDGYEFLWPLGARDLPLSVNLRRSSYAAFVQVYVIREMYLGATGRALARGPEAH